MRPEPSACLAPSAFILKTAVLRLIALVWFAALAVGAIAQLTPAERDGLASALFLRNLTLKDLDFPRREPGGPPLLPAAEQAIDHPLEGADALLRLHASAAKGSLSDLLVRAEAQLRVAPLPLPPTVPPPPVPDSIPAPLRLPVGNILAAMAAADVQIHTALSRLSAAERRIVIDSLPAIAAERQVTFDFAKTPPSSSDTVRALLAKVDMPRLIASGAQLAHDVEAQLPALHAAAATPIPAPVLFDFNGIPVELSGAGSAPHRGMAGGLCIALAGDNHYAGRYGAGIAAASVLIDFGGTASYDVPDLSAGAGLLGVGLVYELADRAHFNGKALAFGAGLAGVGALYREGGDTSYSANALAEGYGNRGVGLLLDSGGTDDYRVHGWGEGAGADDGIGWLIDRAGDDTYVASGLSDAAHAQGFGRGGIGLLTDLAGNDTYRGTARCQGAGERLGVGSLYDASGNDLYFADSAAQGFASDIGAGFLFDLSGDDAYVVRGGACHGTAQSRSVAMLLDRTGNDFYAAADGRPGLATDGGLGIFIDGNGEDRYVSTPGGSVPGRSGDALGIFVDLRGEDNYSDGLDNGQARVEMDGAVAYDFADPSDLPPIESFGPAPGSGQNPGPDGIDALAEEGSTSAANRLVAIGAPAYIRLMQRPIATLNPAVFNALVRLGHLMRQTAFGPVLAKLQDPNPAEQRRALYLAASFGIAAAAPQVQKLMQNAETRRDAVEAAGLLRVRASLPAILALTQSAEPSLVLVAMLAIERMGDEAGIPAADALVTSMSFPTRQSALRLLSHFSASGTRTAQRLVGDPDERIKRIGIELYGRIGTDDALAQAGQFLGDPSPGLKIQAMLAVDGRCPVALRPTLSALRLDSNPAVRAVAARIDPGR